MKIEKQKISLPVKNYDITILKSKEFEPVIEPDLNEISTFNELPNLYLNKFHPSIREYIEGKISDTENAYDNTFGVYFSPEFRDWAIGDSPIIFKESGNVEVKEKEYEGTKGLYELLFKQNPIEFTPQDSNNYINIIKKSNAQFLGYDPSRGLSTSNAKKFVEIIKPIIE
ncbi:unnamed protein product [Psylliodes chrysocephalus]|uniref:DUF8207 domain-containing protein n=1 Tax=Psylliodes chrysocephalus TaxID=3402493 RepID=A0A9P0CMR9_9CUCU|nr:unnamed protein product [Psylliodes chrysocephala]